MASCAWATGGDVGSRKRMARLFGGDERATCTVIYPCLLFIWLDVSSIDLNS